jgi:hypothetical protein
MIEVEFDRSYPLRSGETCYLYRVGDWSFDYIPGADDNDTPESAQHAIEAFTAWRDFLTAGLAGVPETHVDEPPC